MQMNDSFEKWIFNLRFYETYAIVILADKFWIASTTGKDCMIITSILKELYVRFLGQIKCHISTRGFCRGEATWIIHEFHYVLYIKYLEISIIPQYFII